MSLSVALPSPLGSQCWHPRKPRGTGCLQSLGSGWDKAACQHLWDGQHALSLEMAAKGLLGGAFALDLLHCTGWVKPVIQRGLKTELFTGTFMPRRGFAGILPPENTSPISLQGCF